MYTDGRLMFSRSGSRFSDASPKATGRLVQNYWQTRGCRIAGSHRVLPSSSRTYSKPCESYRCRA
eukprot:8539380-Pyramimonas_sp.AAC.1